MLAAAASPKIALSVDIILLAENVVVHALYRTLWQQTGKIALLKTASNP